MPKTDLTSAFSKDTDTSRPPSSRFHFIPELVGHAAKYLSVKDLLSARCMNRVWLKETRRYLPVDGLVLKDSDICDAEALNRYQRAQKAMGYDFDDSQLQQYLDEVGAPLAIAALSGN
jgi:hypothetical protein